MRRRKDFIHFGKTCQAILTTMVICLLASCGGDDENEGIAPEISLNKESLVLEKGKSERLIASFDPADAPNTAHVWNSNMPNIASVDETGLVTAVEIGDAVITARALDGGKTATCNVRVVDKIINVTGISLNITEETVAIGDQVQLVATISPENATDKSVKWTSANNEVATIDANGTVTAVTAGETTVKATTNDGNKTAQCKIKVENRGVKISKPEVSAITSISAYVTGTFNPLGVELQEVGVCYSTQQSPTIDDQRIALTGEDVTCTLTGLSPSTTYYVRLYAIVDGEAKYGDQEVFQTLTKAEISLPTISNITTYAAHVTGTIQTFGIQVEESGICYGTTPVPTIDNEHIVLSGNEISYTLLDLAAETTYYVRIYAKVNGELIYSEQSEFKTIGIIKVKFKPTDIYRNKIILISPTVSGLKEIDICYGTKPHPTVTDHITTATANGNTLRLVLEELSGATTYYIRAYSRVGGKIEYYDEETSVETIGLDSGNFMLKKDASYRDSEPEYQPILRERFKLLIDYTYTINTPGTYLVEVLNGGSVKKKSAGNYTTEIYISGGKGTFSFMRDGAYKEDGWPQDRIYFNSSTDLRITNIETGIRYHDIIKEYYFSSL